MSNDKQIPAQKFFSPLERALREDEIRIAERARRIFDTQYDPNEVAGKDRSLGRQQSNNPVGKGSNFDEKIYMMPASFNALRKFLHENYPNLFNAVNPETGVSFAYCMASDAPQFIAGMNAAFDLVLQMDSDNVDYICKTILNAARQKKGLKPLEM